MESAGEELNELHEQAEHAEHTKMIEVSFTMSVLAVLLAAATLLGHRAHTEEVVLSNDRTDQYNFYQFKKERGVLADQEADVLTVLAAEVKDEHSRENIDKLKDKYVERSKKEREDIDKINDKAKEIEKEKEVLTHKADRFDLAEGFLEVALVICSLTLLTSNRAFWLAGIAIGVAGVVVVVLGLLLH
ncbi:hypothetical protein Acid345_2352 [Candidatus Koribacter versatilis Ellin345]|uniref:DUF4337 domain-containing protein n=1 Tax=Koribacter versatilis (strain Ellin345) TaxID=204669 RepID=Q1IP47_KORVE|nr:DUF4337 domain-containing protein [Candidatus Koribacter versatilis]ABF41353.1 hypothetical protein Acid345_2352 [Candidatus Koribacter versatilis Ellin345]